MSGMPVPDDGQWRNQSFRQNMVSKIEEAILHCGAPTTKNAGEMENQVFSKANSKNEYLSFVARLIIHIKEMGLKPKLGGGAPGQGIVGQQNQQQGNQPGMGMMGQMNQVNSMNQMTPMGVIGQMNQAMQQHQIVPGMQNGMAQPSQQGGPMNVQHQSGTMNMSQQGMNMNQQPVGMQHGGMNLNQQAGGIIGQQGGGIINQGGGMMSQHQSGGLAGQGAGIIGQGGISGAINIPQQTGGLNMPSQQPTPQLIQMNQQQNQNFMNQQMQQQFQNAGIGNDGIVPQISNSMRNPQMQQIQNAQMQQALLQQQQNNQQSQMSNLQQSNVSAMAGRGMPNPSMMQQRMMGSLNAMQSQMPQLPRKGLGPQHRPMGPNVQNFGKVEVGSGVAGKFPGPGGPPMQRPGGNQFMAPNSSPGMSIMGPTPPPNNVNVSGQSQPGFVNSPQPPNMLHSHGSGSPGGPGAIRAFSSQMVPSPNTNLNTPMPLAPTPSPRNAEEIACMEKIKELKKYTDLLQRMIAKIGNEDVEKSSKIKKLLEILINPNQRVSMEILLKCEAALKKMEKQQHDAGGIMAPASQPMPTKDQISPFQQIQDAILTTLKNGSSSHTLLRTFRPTIEALTGQSGQSVGGSDIPEDSDCAIDPGTKFNIPGVLQRELRIMDSRFHVRLSKGKDRSTPLQLLASLTDAKLPVVPPLKIHIPSDYPDERPRLIELQREYAQALKSRLLYLPKKFTVLELLGCWEMSVRQASNPNPKRKVMKRLTTTTTEGCGRLGLSFL